MHKADCPFQGSTIIIECWVGELDPLKIFDEFLASCNCLFPHLPELLLKHDGHVLTHSWFIPCLRNIFPNDNIAGHSLQSGGATALAITRTPLDCIQMIRCWSSEAFLIYLHQNLILLQGDLLGQLPFDGPHSSSWQYFFLVHWLPLHPPSVTSVVGYRSHVAPHMLQSDHWPQPFPLLPIPHLINWDGQLRAHVAWLCTVAWRNLVSTEVHSKLQDCHHYLRLLPPHI